MADGLNFATHQYINPFEGIQKGITNLQDVFAGQQDALAKQKLLDIENARAARAEQRIIDDRAVAADEKKAAVDFSTALLKHGGKNWNDFGGQLNANADRVTSAMALTDEEMKNPQLDSAKAKMKMQQELSDTYDKSGQRMYESEKMNEILNSRKQSGQLITNDMLSAMAGAKKSEEEQRQALSKTNLALAKDYKDNADKMMLEKIKLGSGERNADVRSSSSKDKDGNKHGAGVDDVKKVKDYVSSQVSPGWFKLGEGSLDKAIASQVSKGVTGSDLLKNVSAGIEYGVDNTFNPTKVGTTVSKEGGSGGFNRVVGRSDFSGLDRLETENRIAATNAAQDAKSALMDPNESRALKAKTMFSQYMGELDKRNTPTPTTENVKTGSGGISAGPSTSKEVKTEPTKSIAGGLTDKGMLNADATKAINDRLAAAGINEIIASGMTPEYANKRVNTLLQAADNTKLEPTPNFMSPTARSERAKDLVKALQTNPMSAIGNPFTTISDAYSARWNKSPAESIKINTDIKEIVNNPNINQNEKYGVLLELGLSDAEAKKYLGIR